MKEYDKLISDIELDHELDPAQVDAVRDEAFKRGLASGQFSALANLKRAVIRESNGGQVYFTLADIMLMIEAELRRQPN